jgi:hypothetical protein
MRTFFSPLRSNTGEAAQTGPLSSANTKKPRNQYYPPWPPHPKLKQELPDSYGHTRLVMLVVDPYLACILGSHVEQTRRGEEGDSVTGPSRASAL